MGRYYVSIGQMVYSHLTIEAEDQDDAKKKVKQIFDQSNPPETYIGEYDETVLSLDEIYPSLEEEDGTDD